MSSRPILTTETNLDVRLARQAPRKGDDERCRAFYVVLVETGRRLRADVEKKKRIEVRLPLGTAQNLDAAS
jgi:hypothetical protein